jgi:hypothetical protein
MGVAGGRLAGGLRGGWVMSRKRAPRLAAGRLQLCRGARRPALCGYLRMNVNVCVCERERERERERWREGGREGG